jgi:sialic acid synthase SpsE
MIKRIGFPIIKIGSSNISNVPLLEAVAGIKRPVLLSTGGSTIGEIHKAVEVLESNGASEVGLLHCVLQYPTKPEDVNLRMLLSIQKAFPGYRTGFSDHTMGISASPAAVVLGAKMIEKHFTLDVKMQGPDHAISASPEVMGHMVKLIREVEKELGSHEKGPIQKEKERLGAMRRRIVAASDVSEAGLLTQENIMCMRREDGKGVDSWRWHDVIGKRLKRGVRKGDPITWEDIF